MAIHASRFVKGATRYHQVSDRRLDVCRVLRVHEQLRLQPEKLGPVIAERASSGRADVLDHAVQPCHDVPG